MKVIVSGSREHTDRQLIRSVLAELPTGTIVVHGACKTGADKIAGEEADKLGHHVIAIPAQWSKYGLGAGPIRNSYMLKHHRPDLVLAFPIGASPGTRDMIDKAKSKNIEVRVYEKGVAKA